MTAFRPVIINNGTQSQLPNADSLLVGTGIDVSAAGSLSIGGATATSITIGSASITTDFPGPVTLTGDVTTVGGTTFTTDATFEGDVTFGNASTDTVDFVAEVASNINFAGGSPTYKITNLADGTNPNDAVNFSQLSAIVSGVSAVTASAPLASSGGATPDISLTGIVSVANGGTNSSSFTAGSVIFAGAGGTSLTQDNSNLFWDDTNDRLGIGTTSPNEKLTINGVLSLAEGSAPSATAAFGKLYATSAADARPFWLDDTGQSYNLTSDRFNTLTAGASVAIDTSPALPLFNTVTLDQATTFTTSNLGNGRSASVRVVCDGTTRALTWPVGWTWLGSGAPTSIAANDVGYLSIVAYGATDADVVAGWSYENAPVSVTGSGVDNQIAVWSGTYSQDGSATLTFDGTTFSADGAVVFNDSGAAVDFRVEGDTDANLLFVDGSADFVGIGTASPSAKLTVSGGLTQSSGAVSLTGNAASSLTTSSGALTLTSAAAATWSTAAGNLAISGAANLELAAGAGSEVVVNQAGADVDFRVESDANANMLLVDASADAVAIGTTGVTHTFNIGSGANSNFAVASGGRIHTYDGTNPTDGQVLIGDTALGNFAKSTLTAGSGVSITNGAGTITIAATGSGGTVTSVDVSGGTTGLTTSGGPITGSGTITLAGTLAVTHGGTGTTTQFTAGSVVFAGASGIYSQDNANLFWDDTNDRLGIGTAVPSTALSVFEKFKVDSAGYITGYDNAAITDGEILIGDTGDGRFEKATLTAGTGISVTNGAGTISLAATGTVPLTTTGLTAGDVCYASSTNTGGAAVATAASTSRVLGFVSTVGAPGTIQVTGIYSGANFITVVGLAVGQPVFLSKTSGKLTNDVSTFTTGDVVAEIGIVLAVASGTGGAAAADVLIQPKSIVVL